MSERERAIELLNQIPDSKMGYVIAFLSGAAIPGIEEVEPDEWDLKMIKKAKAENDESGIPIENLAAELGITL